MTEPVFRLDEVAHKAFVDDREIIRATSAFTVLGLIDPTWFTPESRVRGLLIHDAVKAWHWGQAFPVLEAYRGYWQGFLRFIDETGFVAMKCEEPVYDLAPGYAYGGRYDLYGQLPSPMWADGFDDLIDVKTGSMPVTTKWQTAGYGRRIPIPSMRLRRWALVLPGDGTYRLVPLNLKADGQRVDMLLQRRHEADFLSMVRVANLKLGLCA